ncbi:hypothetical protein [Chitinophaga caseinilytica]|uniref:hypothetical protein n=1 Tax=Chitinophaga caseinilytica TaxID=2267521 RepID=UPI003C2F6F01
MKKFIQHTTWLTAIVTLIAGCVKDKGNYDLVGIPGFATKGSTVTVNGTAADISGQNTVRINANDHVKIVMQDEMAKDFDPVYSWMMYEIDPLLKAGSLPDPAVEIASTKDFEQNFGKGPGKYQLYRKTSNKRNGNAFFDTFIIEVASVNGLMVYHKNAAGKADYSVIRSAEMGLGLPADKMGITRNVFSAINQGRTIDKPSHLWLRQIDDGNNPSLILAGSSDGMTLINYRTHVFEHNSYTGLFAFPLESAPAPQGHMNGSNKIEFLVQHGELYYINYMMAAATPKFVQLSTPGTSYSPHMMTIPTSMQPYRMYSNVVFNQTQQRFEYEDNGFLMPFMGAPGPLGALDVDPSATQMELVYMAKGKDNTIDAVMKNALGHLRFVVFDITDPYAVVCLQNIDLSAWQPLTSTSHWAMGERGPVAFFTGNNNIYALNHENATATVQVSVPAAASIKVMKVLKDGQNPEFDNAILFIGYNEGNTGTIVQYAFNPASGAINAGSRKVYTGMGEILDIVLKK